MKYKIEDLTAECYGYRWRKDGSLEWYACEWADIPKGALDSYTDAAGLLRLMEIEEAEAEAEEGLQS